MKRIVPVIVGIMLLLPACSGDTPTAPGPEVSPPLAQIVRAAPVDISGAWTWSRKDHLTFPPFAASLIFGIEPEGQRTVATCHTDGTMELSQTGTSFTSTDVTTTSSLCETLGGQTFLLGPEAGITGEIVGRVALHMAFQGGVLCLYNGAARDISGGVAGALQARGRCVIPGHPRSGVPGFDPPPAGTEVITSWTAERP